MELLNFYSRRLVILILYKIGQHMNNKVLFSTKSILNVFYNVNP
jgi:hypothetical protein